MLFSCLPVFHDLIYTTISMKDNVCSLLNKNYSFIEKYRPRKANDDAVLELRFAERNVHVFTRILRVCSDYPIFKVLRTRRWLK